MALSAADRAALMAAVDRSPEFRGCGVAFVGNGASELVREPPVGAGPRYVVVFEPQEVPNPHPRQVTPDRKDKLKTELVQLMLNCGGTVLWAIGTVFFAAAAAPTGGTSGAAAVVTGAATAAGALQCAASGYRVYNEVSGEGETNDELDKKPMYQASMLALDVVGLAGARGAMKGAGKVASVLRDAGTDLTKAAIGGTMSRPMRRVATTALGNPNGAKRVSSVALTARARKEVLELLGAGLNLSSSATGGVTKETMVYVTEVK